MNITVREHLLELKECRYDKNKNGLVFIDEDGIPFDVDHLFRDFRNFQNGNIYDLQKITYEAAGAKTG